MCGSGVGDTEITHPDLVVIRPSAGARCGDEVHQLLHPAKKGRFQIAEIANGREDSLPGSSDICLVTVGPPQLSESADLDIGSPGNIWPCRDAQALRLDCLPHIHIRVTDHENPGEPRMDFGSDAALLRARAQVVDEDTDPTIGAGTELFQPLRQVIDTCEIFHDDAVVPEIIAPNPFDELSVVSPLDPDPRGAGHPRSVINSPGTGCSPTRGALPGPNRGDDFDGLPVEPPARPQRKRASPSAAVSQVHESLPPARLHPGDLTDETGFDVLEDEPHRHGNIGGAIRFLSWGSLANTSCPYRSFT